MPKDPNAESPLEPESFQLKRESLCSSVGWQHNFKCREAPEATGSARPGPVNACHEAPRHDLNKHENSPLPVRITGGGQHSNGTL